MAGIDSREASLAALRSALDRTPPAGLDVLEPAELAPMAVLLASDAGAGITGQVINVDGGYRL